MNGTNGKQRQIQDCFSPREGGSAVKAVTKVEHQHRACVDREVSEGGCEP